MNNNFKIVKPWGTLLLLCVFYMGSYGQSFQGNYTNSEYFPEDNWEKIHNYQELGWSKSKLEQALKMTDSLNMASTVVLYKGKILIEKGDVQRKLPSHSVRKSLLSATFGPDVDKGTINILKTLDELGIDDIAPPLTGIEKQATIQMLLKARSGIYHKAAFETEAMTASKPIRYSHEPGTFWHYNNWDFNTLGYIYEQETGMGVFEGFKKNIADPIGMKDFDPEKDGRYVYEKEKSKYPAYPFMISARQLARVGLLMARNGRWKDQQVIPKFWVKESTTSYSDAKFSKLSSNVESSAADGGYGYLWWIAVNGHFKGVSNLPLGSYAALGFMGHVLVVIPDMDFVFVYRNDDDAQKNGKKSTSYENIAILLKEILAAKAG